MKAKTINKILSAKHARFVASIQDPVVKELVAKGTIISGGCITSFLQQQPVNDYDMYFRDEETAFAVAEYYAKEYQRLHPKWEVKAVRKAGRVTISVAGSKNHSVAGEVTDPSEPDLDQSLQNFADADDIKAPKKKTKEAKYSPVFLSSNAITLTTGVQLIIRFFGPPDEIHKNFDFVHCTNYWSSWDNKLVLRGEALEAILAKELKYVGSRYPICSIIRTRKFIGRGWTINAGQYVKMCWQVSQLDLTDVEVLKDQLVGVDSAYFSSFIYEMEKFTRDGGVVDQGYVATLIDSIF